MGYPWNGRLNRGVIVFVGGLIVLIALVAGGIYFVHQRGEQARREEAVKIAEANLEKESEVATKPTDQGAAKPEKNNDTKKNDDKAPAKPAKELPETGIDVSNVFTVTILALSIAFYVTSRRAARATLDL